MMTTFDPTHLSNPDLALLANCGDAEALAEWQRRERSRQRANSARAYAKMPKAKLVKLYGYGFTSGDRYIQSADSLSVLAGWSKDDLITSLLDAEFGYAS